MGNCNNTPNIITRPFTGDDDFWRVRNLLIDTYPIAPTGFNWEVRRWDGWRFYNADSTWNPDWVKQVCLWETKNGMLVGAAHPEGIGDVHLEVHPDFRDIEQDMISWAENNLTSLLDNKQRRLKIFVFEYDQQRQLLLEQRGYVKMNSGGVLRKTKFNNKHRQHPNIAEGYTIRTVNAEDNDDCQKIADLLNAAFNRDFHTAAEFRNFAKLAPCYRQDLDLVAVAPDGMFAAYTGVPFNEANNYGIFEPVCTHPEHLRKGLAHRLMLEGLCRLKALGASEVYVVTGDQIAANKLYDSIGFEEVYKGYEWQKIF
ncbi:GNAT family N-acetyltransferase [Candidatus Zixiibacteriota bacterium]